MLQKLAPTCRNLQRHQHTVLLQQPITSRRVICYVRHYVAQAKAKTGLINSNSNSCPAHFLAENFRSRCKFLQHLFYFVLRDVHTAYQIREW